MIRDERSCRLFGGGMPRVAINIVRYNHDLPLIKKSIQAALNQDIEDYTVTLTENGSTDSLKEEVLSLFGSDPKFSYADNGTNLGFAGAHNRFFSRTDAEFLMPLNPDTEMTGGYLRALMTAFDDPKVAACTGKMLRFETLPDGTPVLDGTGIVVSRARLARERGQLQADSNQFDNAREVFGVSGTAPAYRKSALERVRLFEREYFDEDFFAYWEDVDLSWRLQLAGYQCVYVPDAVIYHSRAVGQSEHGYRRPLEVARHRRDFSTAVLRWSWRNQLFTVVKNDFGWSFWRDLPFIVGLQLGMLCYAALLERRTLGAIPDMLRLFPRMLQKRKMIQSHRVATSKQIGVWFTPKTEGFEVTVKNREAGV
jgi:GT2 family glycosyltransferase